MDLKTFRTRKGMTRAQMVRALRPHMKGLSVDDFFLDQLERGEASPDRERAILAAAAKAFPDFAPSPERSAKWRLRRPTLRGAVLLGLAVFFLISGYGFWVFRDRPVLEDLAQYVNILAGFAGIIGTVIAIVALRPK